MFVYNISFYMKLINFWLKSELMFLIMSKGFLISMQPSFLSFVSGVSIAMWHTHRKCTWNLLKQWYICIRFFLIGNICNLFLTKYAQAHSIYFWVKKTFLILTLSINWRTRTTFKWRLFGSQLFGNLLHMQSFEWIVRMLYLKVIWIIYEFLFQRTSKFLSKCMNRLLALDQNLFFIITSCLLSFLQYRRKIKR